MRNERTFNLAWPLVALIGVLLVGGTVYGLGAQLFENPVTKKSYPNKTVAGFLGTTSGTVEIQTMPQPTEGEVLTAGCGTSSATSTNTASCARFRPATGGSLPSGTPGQVPTISAITATGTVTTTATQTTTGTATAGTYSLTATGTVTTTGTEYTTKNGTIDFDPAGIYFVGSAPSEGSDPGPGDASTGRWMRWRTVRDNGSLLYLTYAGTCSSGSDALIMTMTDNGSYWGAATSSDLREVWPGGNWMASLRAKVNANEAAIRIEVWRDAYYGEAYDAQLFSWTTDSFTNTDFATVSKMSIQPEIIPLSNKDKVMFKLYATCSSSTTVTVDVGTKANGWASRIYSPFVLYRVQSTDIPHFGSTASVGAELSYLSNMLGGAIEDISTLDEQKEEVTYGTPGQFVKFAGTGTSTTTSKEAGLPGLTTRKFTVKASDFAYGSGAASGNIGTQMHVWTLRDGQQDYIYSTVLELPADYVSGLTVSMIWIPSATDNTSTNMVRWKIIAQALTAGASPPYNNRVDTWNGSQCGTGCQEGSVVKETAKALTAFSSGTPYSISVMRDGHSAGDTYVGDVKWIGMEFSYTSSF